MNFMTVFENQRENTTLKRIKPVPQLIFWNLKSKAGCRREDNKWACRMALNSNHNKKNMEIS